MRVIVAAVATLASLGVLLAGGGGPAAAQQAPETLSAQGSYLEDVLVDRAGANLTRRVDIGGDKVAATHVMAHLQDGRNLQRNNLGYWVPWDGDTGSLIDNHFAPSNGTLTFKIMKEDISDVSFPITVTVAYRTGSTLKFGSFTVMPQ